jgi:hypothetical protein
MLKFSTHDLLHDISPSSPSLSLQKHHEGGAETKGQDVSQQPSMK